MALSSSIYRGQLRHRRFLPRYHQFTYKLTLFYLDLDELPELFSGVRYWSYERVNLGAFFRRDYLGDSALPLKQEVQRRVAQALGYCPQGPVRMLTNLRLWGVCFNPVTFYYVFEPGAENPSVILAEVNNTPWDERHTYIICCDRNNKNTQTQFQKELHVSPFNPLAMIYRWISSAPGKNLLVHMEAVETAPAGGLARCHMDATLSLSFQPWDKSRLERLIWSAPWGAFKVPLSIYWQALKLWCKSVPFYAHPGALSKPAASPLVAMPDASSNLDSDTQALAEENPSE